MEHRLLNRRPLILALALLGGCFYPDHDTPLPSCERQAGARVARGSLRVLPSEVAGIGIDSASWHDHTGSPDMNVETTLFYEAFLSATVAVPLDSIAVRFRSSRAADDSALLVAGFLVARRTDGGSARQMSGGVIRPAEPRYALAALSRRGRKPGPWGCPRSVQVIHAGRG